ncbi:MAG: hypothetical protein AAGG02_05655 [Cyanobacteria bacterium P01_H01_bin.15]
MANPDTLNLMNQSLEKGKTNLLQAVTNYRKQKVSFIQRVDEI